MTTEMLRPTRDPADPPLTRHLGICNPWMLMTAYTAANPNGNPPVYISYRAATTSRASQGAAWQIIDARRRKTDTSENAYWRDNGWRTFDMWRAPGETRPETKTRLLTEAITWTREQYGITEPFVKINGMRGGAAVVPESVAKWARTQLAAARKQEKENTP